MVDGVKNKFHAYPNVEVIQMDANDIPFEQDSLDVVIANHMLYHIDNVDGVLKSVSNILKTGGKLYAATNGESSMSELWSILRNLGIERKYCKITWSILRVFLTRTEVFCCPKRWACLLEQSEWDCVLNIEYPALALQADAGCFCISEKHNLRCKW